MAPSVHIIGTRGYPSFYGGFETLVRKLAPFLADEGWDVTVYGRPGCTSDASEADPRVKSVETKGLSTQSLSTLSYGMTSVLTSAIAKCDVALVMNVANGFWLPALKARGVKTIVNVDGIEWERDKWGPGAKRAFRAGAALTARYADELVFDSLEIGKYWGAEFGRDGTFIPYGGERTYPKRDSPKFAPGSYVLLVARFVPENTIDEFIAAAEMINDVDIVIVGSSGFGGEYEYRVAALAAQKSNVTWLGHIADDRELFSLWENCGAYFHGHSVGGTNPALVQAMACGAPTVARDTKYNREVLDGNAVFVEPEPVAIAEAVSALVRDTQLQGRLSVGAKARSQDRYTWEGVCKTYANLVNEVSGVKDVGYSDIADSGEGKNS